jgi:hypothetical protein
VITLHTPSGGEILNTNAPYVISWSYDNPSAYYVYLEYSSDNGQNWNYIDYVLNPGSAGNYQWTSPAVESDQYLVRVSDYNLDFVADTSNAFSVISYPETPICMVTVDSATNRNLIVWEKPVSPLIDHFVVYKESGVAGVYESIGSVSYDSLSTFTDQNSNPAIKSYRYKLGFNDAAGHVFPSGNLHQTIHLSINKGVGDAWNLIWTDYMGFTVGSYNIYRGTSPADMSLITSISASFNSFTDIEAPAGSIYYVVEVVNPNGCIPTVKSNTYSNSRSNIATNKNLGVNTIKDGMRVSVYPNPVSEDIHVDITGPGLQPSIVLELRDLLGRVVYSGIAMQTEALNKHVVNVRDLREGVYMLVVVSGERQSVNKIIIRR